jgi:hypothetical protein
MNGLTTTPCASGGRSNTRGCSGIKGDPEQGKEKTPYEKALTALRAACSTEDSRAVQHQPALLWLRHQQTVAELDAIKQQNDQHIQRIVQLEAELDGTRPPTQVVDALRSHGCALRPVRVNIDGVSLVAGVQPTGRIDPAAEKREWRRLQAQHRKTAPHRRTAQ